MDVGVFVPLGNGNATPQILRAVGPEVEQRGFESIWVPEHVVLFDEYRSTYPYSTDGNLPGGPDTGMLEPLTALTYLAAVTDRIVRAILVERDQLDEIEQGFRLAVASRDRMERS